MTESKPKRPINEIAIIASILLGALGFAFTFFSIESGIMPTKGDVKFYLSTTTKYSPGNDNAQDTIFFGDYDFYHSELEKMRSDSTIRVCGLDSCSTHMDSLSFARSDYYHNKIFVSENGASLKQKIKNFDQNLKAKFEDKTGSEISSLAKRSKYFYNLYPLVLIWLLLIAVAAGYSFMLIPGFIAGIRKYRKGLNGPIVFWNVVLAIVLLIIVLFPQYLSQLGNYEILLPSNVQELFGVGYKPVGLLIGSLVPFIGPFVWLILIFFLNSYISNFLHKPNINQLKKLEMARKEFEQYFLSIALLLALTIFATSTLLNTLNSLIHSAEPFRLFPAEFSIMNGIIQTFMLTLIYVTINANFEHIEKGIMASSEHEALAATEAMTFMDYLKTFMEYLKIILTILAPLIGSGFQSLIEFF